MAVIKKPPWTKVKGPSEKCLSAMKEMHDCLNLHTASLRSQGFSFINNLDADTIFYKWNIKQEEEDFEAVRYI